MLIKILLLAVSLATLVSCGGGGDSTTSSGPSSPNFPGFITASAIVDLNNDLKNDLIVMSQGNGNASPFVLINNGDGSFTKRTDFLPEQYKGAYGVGVDIKSADMNKDGYKDLLIITVDGSPQNFYAGAKIQLFLGSANGVFTDASSNIDGGLWPIATCINEVAIFFWPDYLRVVDLNSDGALDFIVTSPGTCGGIIYLNQGAGIFKVSNINVTYGDKTQSFPSLMWWKSVVSPSDITLVSAGDVLVGDINKDGKPDLFAPSQAEYQTRPASSTNAVFINNSTADSLQFTVKLNPTESAIKNGVLLDIDGDGYLDFVGSKAISGSPTLTVPIIALKGDGLGGFTQNDNLLYPTTGFGLVHARLFLATDLNDDGRDDLLIADHGYETIGGTFPGARNWLFINTGTRLEDKTATSLDLLAGYTHQASVGDLDGDGRQDIFLNNAGCNGTTMLCDNQARFWRNIGAGNFQSYNPVLK